MDNQSSSYGKRIRQMRKQYGLSQEEFAKKAKISVNSLKRYETGERQPSIGIVDRMAAALGITTPQFLWEDESKSSLWDFLLAANPSAKANMKEGSFTRKNKELVLEICLLVARNCVGNYRESFDVFRMLDNYFSLDWKAQSKTYVYIEDLTKVPEYLKRKSHFYIEGQKILQEIKEGNKVPSNAIPPQEPLPPETPDVTEETPTPDTEKDSEEG